MGNTGKMMRFDNLFLFKNDPVRGLVCIHGLIREPEVTTYQLNNACMHN